LLQATARRDLSQTLDAYPVLLHCVACLLGWRNQEIENVQEAGRRLSAVPSESGERRHERADILKGHAKRYRWTQDTRQCPRKL
jgi:hypothetical protein